MKIFPGRRWVRFSLRGLLALVALSSLPLIWAGRQVRLVEQRRALQRTIPMRMGTAWIPRRGGGGGLMYPFANHPDRVGDEQHRVSAFRKWLGDNDVDVIYLFRPDEDIEPIANAFPEATIYRHLPYGSYSPTHL